MNNPPYNVVDELKLVVDAVNVSMTSFLATNGLTQISYNADTIEKLKESLILLSKNQGSSQLKFPLIYVQRPFKLKTLNFGWYAALSDLSIYIIHSTNKQFTWEQRQIEIYQKILYPIYKEFMQLLARSKAFDGTVPYLVTCESADIYYWGEDQKNVLNDIVDIMLIRNPDIKVNNNPNCVVPSLV
jgi:hypothetical protein